jgi:hypothetical protein
MSLLQEQASCAPSQKPDSYIYALAPIASNGIAAITSADELLLLDRQNLQTATPLYFSDVPTGVTCMVPSDAEGTSIICAGRDGVIATFDTRSQKKTAQFNQSKDGFDRWLLIYFYLDRTETSGR